MFIIEAFTPRFRCTAESGRSRFPRGQGDTTFIERFLAQNQQDGGLGRTNGWKAGRGGENVGLGWNQVTALPPENGRIQALRYLLDFFAAFSSKPCLTLALIHDSATPPLRHPRRLLLANTEALCLSASEVIAGGVTLLQYRNKSGNARQMIEQARELKRRLSSSVKLIMNDRADLCLAAEFDGVHVGQEDLSPEGARKVIGEALWLGVSTHNSVQLAEAE